MTRVARIELRNFKSFKKALIPFANGFTAIVGANASGKSNVLDSLLFGLGITSMKLVRASKLTDLVNYGADEPFARVTVELKSQDKTFEITRMIDNNGKGEFKINGNPSTLNEINSLTAELGIRADGHNIVVQGDVTKLIEMNPRQRREIIDEIAGLKEFDEKKEEAEKELLKVDEKIKETSIVMKERKVYLDQLEKDREAAIEFQMLSEQTQQSKQSLIMLELSKIEKDLREQEQRIEKSGKETSELLEKAGKARKEKEEITAQLKKIENELIGEKTSDAEQLAREIEKTRTQLEFFLEKNTEKEKQLTEFEEEGKKTRQRIEENAMEKKELFKKKDSLEKELEEIIKELGKEAQKKELKKEAILMGKKQAIEKEKKIMETINNLSETKEEYYKLQGNLMILRNKVEEKEKSLKRIKENPTARKIEENYARIKNSLSLLEKFLKELKKKETEEIRKKLEKITMEFRQATVSLEKNITEITGREKEKETRKELEAMIKEMKDFAANKEELEKKIKLIEEEKKETEESLKKIREKETILEEAAVEQATEKKNRMESQLTAINSKIESIEREEKNTAEQLKKIEEQAKNISINTKKIIEETVQKKERLEKIEQEFNAIEEKTKGLKIQRQVFEEKTIEMEGKIRVFEQKRFQLEKTINELRIEISKKEVRENDLREELKEFKNALEKPISQNEKELREKIALMEKRIMELGAINMKAIELYESLKKEFEEVESKLQVLGKEQAAVLELIEKIEVKRTNSFMNCFEQINKNFLEIFKSIFETEARLALTNQEKPLEAGLIIEAKHKSSEKLKNLDSMSGGEKSLTALSFLFAIQLYAPAPFYFFDEADAALDKENSKKLAKMIREISKKSQFIAITHNDSMIQEADQVIGVTLNQQKSSVIGLKLRNEQ